MKNYILLLLLVFVLFSCNNTTTDETNTTNNAVEATEEFDEMSIFQLPSTWKTQNNETVEFKDFQGEVLVVVMIYTSCKAACPRLVADMRNIEAKVKSEANQPVKYILVSIDPETDTPERLKAFAIENQMDTEQWVFLQGSDENTREFANILAVKYKEISPIDFSHSNIISIFNQQGVLVHQQEGLGVDNKTTVDKIIELAAP
ncbi:MAG: SCO family protein [Flavobacteriales bacterium]|nr:SCO family protein [Flavobacteriales bacterium]MCW8911832.1 SCO family protein [Flavobacteriales bacterium]MCW8936397.1 SCO family protein [Flavobacteriales bacterium]MCW8939592.1 SCO family protein [Flavobacteriales bacterium]MCW8967737.1 SCO family protein [Flavobacteriales bacterium]